MSTTLSFGPVAVQWPWNYQLVVVPNNTLSQGPWSYTTTTLTNGVGAGQADTLYTAQISLALSTSTTLNLSSITSQLGTSIAFARLKAFYFENSANASSTSLALFGAGATPFTGGFISAGGTTLTLRNGMHLSVGVCQDATGYAVSTGVSLEINNTDSSHAALVNVGLVGCST